MRGRRKLAVILAALAYSVALLPVLGLPFGPLDFLRFGSLYRAHRVEPPASEVPKRPKPHVPTRPTPHGPKRPTPHAPKLGIGVYDGGDGMIRALEVARPPVILLMDPNLDWAKKMRQRFPDAFIVGRIYAKDQPLDHPAERGAAFADLVATHAVPLRGVVDAWMSYNEVTDRTRKETYVAYNTFQVAFARRLQGNYGIAAVAGNDATATVEPEDYARYFREAIEESAYFGIHLYAPKGVSSMRHPDGRYLMLRYREIKAELDRARMSHGPFIITEAGLWDGWRGVVSEAEMAEDFIWYAEELRRDPYVKGVAIYGLFDSTRREWWSFNILGTTIVDQIGAYNTRVAH